jgi:hypothetical protein
VQLNACMRCLSHRKLHSLPGPFEHGDRIGYGKKFEEEADDQKGKSREKEKAQRETFEVATRKHFCMLCIMNKLCEAGRHAKGTQMLERAQVQIENFVSGSFEDQVISFSIIVAILTATSIFFSSSFISGEAFL